MKCMLSFFFEFHYRAPRGTEPHVELSVECTLICSRCLLVNRVILAAFKLPWPEWLSLRHTSGGYGDERDVWCRELSMLGDSK
jgi:hypothetical protein